MQFMLTLLDCPHPFMQYWAELYAHQQAQLEAQQAQLAMEAQAQQAQQAQHSQQQ